MKTSPIKSYLLNQVLKGHFPEMAVRKMNRDYLERFVLKLVKYSSNVSSEEPKDFAALCRSLFLKEAEKPEWWPSEQVISKTLTSDGKYIMTLLRFLVYKCCEFFKKPSENLNTELHVTEVDLKQRVNRKRKLSDDDGAIPIKRRTLLPRSCCKQKKSSENLRKMLPQPVADLRVILHKPQALNQNEFLRLFKLESTSSLIQEDTPNSSLITNSIKFNTCSQIPFSSDLGMELIKRDNHICPEVTKSRKLDRLEWYINKVPLKAVEVCSYEVTYQEKKGLTYRYYKFPKRQIGQHPGDIAFQTKTIFSRLLKVTLVRHNLKKLQQVVKRKSKREGDSQKERRA
ncbi:uncharacterized protein [Euwallacea fornicatus]|uniref:uncharacterized protein n=1 Tax=Euwallacea fornicatus TaxID=995702 RepID=UPI00338E290E